MVAYFEAVSEDALIIETHVMIKHCIQRREVTAIPHESLGWASTGLDMADPAPPPAEVKTEDDEKKEAEEEVKEEEVEEPDDTPVDLAEFWVKPDQVGCFTYCSNLSVLSLRESTSLMRGLR